MQDGGNKSRISRIQFFHSKKFRGTFGHGLCLFCIKMHGKRGKNMFTKARRGTC